MQNNTSPRVIRDRLSPGKALAVQLLVAVTFWLFVYWVLT